MTPQAGTADGEKPVAAASTDANRMSSMIRDLASDEFAGRAPGTQGETVTIAYIAQALERAGVEPGGPNGSWTQDVPLVRTQVDVSVQLTLDTPAGIIPLVQGKDVYISTQRNTDRARIAAAPLVFVGYGVDAPENGWDDFKGADIAGKIAVFLVNDPDFGLPATDPLAGTFGGQAMTYYGRWSYKFEEAVRRGAVGALIVHDTPAAGYGWNTIVAPRGENYDIAATDGGSNRLIAQGWLSAEAAQRVFSAASLDLDALAKAARSRDFKPVALTGLTIDADVPVSSETVISHNVIGKITGAVRPDETISFGAHWDAYGVSPTANANGQTIRRGALDDASGVAGVIELARMFKEGPAPDRTVLFGFWTAEERGLLGAEHFMASGLYPVDKMVANITLDTLQPNGRAKDFILIGAGQSTLENDLASAAAAQGRTITRDGHPERGLFYRADHFAFAKRGVPALIMMALGGGVDLENGGREAGDRWVTEFTRDCYHQTCDNWRASYDFSGAAQDVDMAYAIGSDLAHSDRWPHWQASSEFAKLRD
ncbi:M20/M25/M40 family metallo-hydrolase [Croceicoccus sp. Ery15]|uniref:M20/M25/M40 family metallo-hydrolase n=1 Tax=Croceicoccus sp. Ery15 TaxID=1703338 RepID=UPI00351CC655